MQNDDPDTPDVEWQYAGGCFSDNRAALYVPATPNMTYTFSDVMITVRETEIAKTSWLVFIFMFIGIVTILLFVGIVVAGRKGMLPK